MTSVAVPVYPIVAADTLGVVGFVGSAMILGSHDGSVCLLAADILDDDVHAPNNSPAGVSRANHSNNSGNNMGFPDITDVVAAVFCNRSKRIALTTATKVVQVWQLNVQSTTVFATLLWNRVAIKRANSIAFSRDGSRLLLADKFGDVFGFCIDDDVAAGDNWIIARIPDKPTPTTTTKEEAMAARSLATTIKNKLPAASNLSQNATSYPLVLGHISMLLDVAVSPCGRFVLTAERDENIKVSHYPNSYDIHNFLLGHTQYVSCLCLIDGSNMLISGGGDSFLAVWDWLKGDLLTKFELTDILYSNTESVAPSGKSNNEDDGDSEAVQGSNTSQQINVRSIKHNSKDNVLFVLVEGSKTILVLDINVSVGKLTHVSTCNTTQEPIDIAVEADGRVLVSTLCCEDEDVCVFELVRGNNAGWELSNSDRVAALNKMMVEQATNQLALSRKLGEQKGATVELKEFHDQQRQRVLRNTYKGYSQSRKTIYDSRSIEPQVLRKKRAKH